MNRNTKVLKSDQRESHEATYGLMKMLHKGVIQSWQDGLGHESTIVKAAQKLKFTTRRV